MITLFSDTHLGASRSSHTTPASRQRLKEALYRAARDALVPGNHNYCLGDLFDSYDVDGKTLLQGNYITRNADFVLAGNHDFANRSDTCSGLEVLMSMNPGKFESERSLLAKVSYRKWRDGDCLFYAVGHKLTQELFEASLDAAVDDAIAAAHDNSVLLLHCNYDSPFAKNEATLNLTANVAEALFGGFDLIFIGHEHMPRVEQDGRLVLVGNTHPTSFADISDKYRWHLDTDKMTYSQAKLWDKAKGYLALPVESLLNADYEITPHTQFIEVTGEIDAKDMPQVARATARLWRESEHLLMVRNAVARLGALQSPQTVDRFEDIPARITKSLEGSPLQATWLNYLQEALRVT